MKRLSFFVFLFLIGCEDTREIVRVWIRNILFIRKSNGISEYNEDLANLYRVRFSNRVWLVSTPTMGYGLPIPNSTDWVSLVNPTSMTDEDGDAHIMFAAWEEFIGRYCNCLLWLY